MKITTFDPMIISSKAGDIIELFGELGFKKTHAPVTSVEAGDFPSYRMKDENGFHVDVADAKQVERDMTFIRMNVDDFEEAYNILTAHGFKNTKGDRIIDTKSAKAATLASPSGFIIVLVKHIKK